MCMTSIRNVTLPLLMLLVLAGTLVACGGGGGSIGQAIDDADLGDSLGGGGLGDAIGGDDHTGEPVKGDYALSETWDLSGPLGSGRTLGDVVTDLLVLELAARVPAEGAIEAIDGLVRPIIKREVDGLMPEALRPDSPLMTALAQTLASVEVVSELRLEDGGLAHDLKGTERILALSFSSGEERIVMTPDELFSSAGLAIEADWIAQARGDGRSIQVDDHHIELRYGALVLAIVEVLLGETREALAASVADAIECRPLVGALLDGRDEFRVEVAGVEHDLGADALVGACQSLTAQLAARALGLFALDAKVVVGGEVLFTDEDGDGLADTLRSGEDFGGYVAVAPEFIAPRLRVRFEGVRLE